MFRFKGQVSYLQPIKPHLNQLNKVKINFIAIFERFMLQEVV